MRRFRFTVVLLVVGLTCLFLQACGGGGTSKSNAPSGSGITGVYTSVENEEMTFEFKSDGSVVAAAKGLGESKGTYTVDGEKIIVDIDKQKHTFIRDGNCIEEGRNIYGKMCKGGKAGEASNVSTRELPNSGTWIAVNDDGEFKIEFKPGNKLSLSMTPKIGKPSTHDGKYVIEKGNYYATLDPGKSMVLKFVNDTFESSAFGLPMKFVKQ